MNEFAISRRALLRASAAGWVVALTPVPLAARTETVIPDGYVAWLRRRDKGWEISCAARRLDMSFATFSTATAPFLSPADSFDAPIGLARETILRHFARSTGLTLPQIAFNGGSVRGEGMRVPAWMWADFA